MTREQAARAVGVAVKDVIEVRQGEHGTVVSLRDGGQRLIRGHEVYGYGDHPSVRALRRYVPPAPEPKVEPAPKAEERKEEPAPKPKPKPRQTKKKES